MIRGGWNSKILTKLRVSLTETAFQLRASHLSSQWLMTQSFHVTGLRLMTQPFHGTVFWAFRQFNAKIRGAEQWGCLRCTRLPIDPTRDQTFPRNCTQIVIGTYFHMIANKWNWDRRWIHVIGEHVFFVHYTISPIFRVAKIQYNTWLAESC